MLWFQCWAASSAKQRVAIPVHRDERKPGNASKTHPRGRSASSAGREPPVAGRIAGGGAAVAPIHRVVFPDARQALISETSPYHFFWKLWPIINDSRTCLWQQVVPYIFDVCTCWEIDAPTGSKKMNFLPLCDFLRFLSIEIFHFYSVDDGRSVTYLIIIISTK